MNNNSLVRVMFLHLRNLLRIVTVLMTVVVVIQNAHLDAAVISNQEIFDSWIRGPQPIGDAFSNDPFVLTPNSLDFPDNGEIAISSNFTPTGDFVFSADLTPHGADNDRIGIMFGTGLDGHVRISLDNLDPSNPSTTAPEVTGLRGLTVVDDRRDITSMTGDVTVLANNNTIGWEESAEYRFTISRTGNDLSVGIQDLDSNLFNEVFNFSNYDFGFLNPNEFARVGIFSRSQYFSIDNVIFSGNSILTPVPEPSSMIGILLGCSLFAGRRYRKKFDQQQDVSSP